MSHASRFKYEQMTLTRSLQLSHTGVHQRYREMLEHFLPACGSGTALVGCAWMMSNGWL